MKASLIAIGPVVLTLLGNAQNLLPNPGFAAGTAQPAGWRLADGAGEWATSGPAGTNRVVRVRGNGDDQSIWRAEVKLQPGGLYALHFHARRSPDASGGTAVAGTSRVNRDFPLDGEWREYRFIFREPDDATNDFVRLGQWHVNGVVEFDDAELLPVLASHQSVSGAGDNELRLGAAEKIEGGRYRFAPDFGWQGAEFHRPLWRATASFNSDRWVFSPGAEVVYRFGLAGCEQTNARVSVAINYHVAGTLHLDASLDGERWTPVATFDGKTPGGTRELPAGLLPATNVFVRLRTPDAASNLQVNRCDYEAGLASAAARPAEGRTDFLELLHCDPQVTVEKFQLSTTLGQGLLRLFMAGTSRFADPLPVVRELSGPTVQPSPSSRGEIQLRRDFAVCPTVKAGRPGDHELLFAIRTQPDRTLLAARTVARLSHLYDPRAGYCLAGANGLAVWWCESGWKIARASQPPAAEVPVKPVTVSAARGEFEAAQVLIRPESDRQLISADVSLLTGPGGEAGRISVRVDELAYVHVTRPTDGSCVAGWYPDPLPPLKLPRELKADVNFPLWLTFDIARDAKPGDYTGELSLKVKGRGGESELRVPLAVHVYDFELPRETHLRSALGLGAGEINRYHQLANRADQVAVFEKYLQNFAEHRISPYSFYDYAPIKVRFEGEGTNKHARVDFTEFDAWASRWLGGGASGAGSAGVLAGSPFNTFQLPLRGMGGGTFYERHLGELEGFQEGTPEHARLFKDYLGQVERHLREKGWLDQAFTYWFDEPDPKDYDFVVAGQQRIKAAAPGLKRMLTEQPEPALLGNVDIWCGLTPEWTPEKVRARRAAGEEVWWYICTGPKAPYVTEFIDHPGTELRLWPWQSWQYGVTGILIWATVYWTSPVAYPEALQNPWDDPMSWVSGYGTPKGTRSPWGNGDGRFLYPPRRDPNAATAPSFDAPINSVRWENLRDGMEDYEYFWLLDREVKRVAATKGEEVKGEKVNRAELLAAAKALLAVPENVSKDLTHFTTDPRPLLERRDRMARTIERLKRLSQ